MATVSLKNVSMAPVLRNGTMVVAQYFHRRPHPGDNLSGPMRLMRSFLGKNYFYGIYSTMVVMFIIIILPLLTAGMWLLWLLWLRLCTWLDTVSCEHCEVIVDSNPQQEHYIELKYECCKRSVVPILKPLPPDCDFRHSCGVRCERTELELTTSPTAVLSRESRF